MKPGSLFTISLTLIALLACNCCIFTLPALFPTATPTRAAQAGPTETPAPPPPVNTSAAPFNLAWEDRSLFRAGLTSTYQGVLDDLSGASIYHITLSISDPPALVHGIEEVRYTNQEDVSLTEVDFAIFSEILGGSIAIRKTLIDNQPVTPTRRTGFLRFALPTPLEPGDSVTFHIEFEVSVPTLGGGFYYGIFGYNEGILSLAHAIPTILVYDHNGWNSQTPDLDGDPLFADASFYLVSVDAPANLVLVASGVEVQRSQTEGRQRVLYANGPARDFYLAAAPGLVKKSVAEGEIIVNIYAFADMEEYSQSALEFARSAIQIFSQRYASYPYTEFDIVPIVTDAGGVEFPGMTCITTYAYGPTPFLQIAVVHEVGHQWFYNLVGNETQNQPWLDESVVEFITWQYYTDRYGQAGALAYEAELKATWYSNEEIPIGQPVSAYSSDDYVEIIYGRGAFFLAALRDRMGEAAFDRFMREYVRRFAWEIATTEDFKALAEEECACNLTPLFEKWVYP